jgi:glycerophosphoryl diester phosphodiesterase
MKKFLVLIVFTFFSCVIELPTAPELNNIFNDIENQTIDLGKNAKSYMNGIYKVIQGSKTLGDEVVGKWVGKRWCLYSRLDVVYSENGGGKSGDFISLAGFLRIVRSGAAHRDSLSIHPEEGGKELAADTIPKNIIIRGKTSEDEQIVLQRLRNLNETRKIDIIAHRGGGRNSERLGYSENSIEMMIYSQILGATGIEIDVKRTRDGQLIIFHDDTFSPRTVKGSYLLGRVDNFDLNQIKAFGQLINGEKIPTLSEALKAIIEKTTLSTVWLDMKDPNAFKEAISIVKEEMGYANSKNRILSILLGISNEDLLQAYHSSKSPDDSSKILIEFNVDSALSTNNINCRVWAPRWTNGIPGADINRCHTRGIKVFVWTLDVRDFIADFLYNSSVDGILTNYPSLVSAMHYSEE